MNAELEQLNATIEMLAFARIRLAIVQDDAAHKALHTVTQDLYDLRQRLEAKARVTETVS